MCLGVGKSGSPTPRLMTSRPCASASRLARSISTKRYGGRVLRRSANSILAGNGCVLSMMLFQIQDVLHVEQAGLFLSEEFGGLQRSGGEHAAVLGVVYEL